MCNGMHLISIHFRPSVADYDHLQIEYYLSTSETIATTPQFNYKKKITFVVSPSTSTIKQTRCKRIYCPTIQLINKFILVLLLLRLPLLISYPLCPLTLMLLHFKGLHCNWTVQNTTPCICAFN